MKTVVLAIILTFSYPQIDSTIQVPKQKIVMVDTAKTAPRKSTPAVTVIGSIIALIVLYIILGPMKK